jgi:hypothetical protein
MAKIRGEGKKQTTSNPLSKEKRVEDPGLLKLISKLPCMACEPPLQEDLNWVLENLDIAPRRSDPHHVTSRGAGGDDTPENLMPLCRRHHNEWEDPFKGPKFVIENYPGVKIWLTEAGRFDVFERLGIAFDKTDGTK